MDSSNVTSKIYPGKISYYLPGEPIDVIELAKENLDWDMGVVKEKTGIAQIYKAHEDETAVDLAQKSCEKLFLEHGILKEEVEGLILVTQSPDYALPTSACLLQQRLGLSTDILAFD